MKKIALINGVNLDRLGIREPEIYGSTKLSDIVIRLRSIAVENGCEFIDFQSNHEGDIVDKIAELTDKGFDGVIINPGAFTHTSIAIRDAIAGSTMRFIEIHISNIYKRESFRHTSLTAPVCEAIISGMGVCGYEFAMNFLLKDKKI